MEGIQKARRRSASGIGHRDEVNTAGPGRNSEGMQQEFRSLGNVDGRSLGAGKFAISMEKCAQEGVSWGYGFLSCRWRIPVRHWPAHVCSDLRELGCTCAERFNFPPFLRATVTYTLMAFSSTVLAYLGTSMNSWRSLPEAYMAAHHPRYGPPVFITGAKTVRCSGR